MHAVQSYCCCRRCLLRTSPRGLDPTRRREKDTCSYARCVFANERAYPTCVSVRGRWVGGQRYKSSAAAPYLCLDMIICARFEWAWETRAPNRHRFAYWLGANETGSSARDVVLCKHTFFTQNGRLHERVETTIFRYCRRGSRRKTYPVTVVNGRSNNVDYGAPYLTRSRWYGIPVENLRVFKPPVLQGLVETQHIPTRYL